MVLRRSFLMFGAWVLLMYAGCSEVAKNHPQAVEERCGVCHDLPPWDSSAEMPIHFNHVIDISMERNLQCWQCHLNCDTVISKSEIVNPLTNIPKDTFITVMVWTLDSLHRNDKLDLDSTFMQCRLCHHYRSCDDCHGVPPNDVSNPISQRVHDVHVTRQGFGCDTCHKGYDPEKKEFPIVRNGMTLETTHDNGVKDVVFNVKRKPGHTETPFYDSTAKTCNNLYCHGAMTRGGKPAVAVNDIMTQDSTRCSFCHSIDILLAQGPTHSVESHADLFPDCLNCHPEFRLKTLATNESTHRNVVLDTISCIKCDECHSYPHACTR